MERQHFVARLDQFLESPGVSDYGPNGLQVEGKSQISRVMTAVTASLEAIEAARDRGFDALVVHHGIFWDHQSRTLRGHRLARVRALLEGDLNLLAYHLPLDRHPEVGNNAPVLRALGGQDLQPFAVAKGVSVGYRCRFDPPLRAEDLVAKLRQIYGLAAPEPTLAFLEGPDSIQSLALVSGGAQGELQTAIDAGLDAFVTGEVSEYNLHLAREEGIHHISVGHHASECIGPRLLAEWISRELALEAEFCDFPNPA